MRNLIIFILMIHSSFGFSAPVFTSIHMLDGKNVYVATSDESGKNLTPKITKFNTATSKKSLLSIPQDLKSREILGMFFHHETLYVVSQWRIERGDKPRLHAFETNNKKWNRLGEFSCLSPKEIVFENKKVSLTCFGDKESSIEVAKLQLAMARSINLPQKSVQLAEKRELTLQGLDYYWKSMKLTNDSNKNIKLFSASEF